MGRGSFQVAPLLVLALAAACTAPKVPHPMAGQSRYLCCNLHYEKPDLNDANYQVGALVPLGTRVQVLEVRGNEVTFQPAGHPPLTLAMRYGKQSLGMERFLDRLFVADDPRTRLPRAAAPGKGKGKGKGRGQEPATASDVARKIEQGIVEPGMTREQVLMALGYPPAHRTPSLDAPAWTYWQNRWVTFVVQFDGDRVSHVGR